ncbi:hypothetical protein [Desulfoluna spongiiphila]|uniref:hypothetical protein n=1 Tax=Desulfoluna spongiiphila TaxID=419481 RepID=UPI00125498CE|nr:hypothetical protein [Desulfoluna spongiiphila]VVS90767.1 hypothetical protein DBB_3350 [Desulfoluna spongiiphila]
MYWYQVDFTADDVNKRKLNFKIRDQFERLCVKAEWPDGAALYETGIRENNICTLYFSPESLGFAKELISRSNGKKCNGIPQDMNVFLVVGSK